MELNSALVGVIILLFIFVPIVYLIINAAGKDKKITKTVSQLAQNNGIQLKNVDIIGNCVIGIDDISKKLVHTSKRNPSADFKIINMEDVRECRAKSIKQNEKTLDWVGLELMGKNGSNEIPFYNEYDEFELSKDPFVCLQDAKRWETLLRPMVKAS